MLHIVHGDLSNIQCNVRVGRAIYGLEIKCGELVSDREFILSIAFRFARVFYENCACAKNDFS